MRRQSLQRQLPRLEGAHASGRLHFTSGFWVTVALACLHGCDSGKTARTKKERLASTRKTGRGLRKGRGGRSPPWMRARAAMAAPTRGLRKPASRRPPRIPTIAPPNSQGEAAQEAGKQVPIFRGVPYAAAPTGALR